MNNWGRSNKYNATSSTYGGHVYASKLEASYAMQLDLRLKAKDIKSWSRQPQIDLMIYGKTAFKYKLDFEIEHNDLSTELVEVKGFETRDWALKWKILNIVWAVEHPEITLSLVKAKDI